MSESIEKTLYELRSSCTEVDNYLEGLDVDYRDEEFIQAGLGRDFVTLFEDLKKPIELELASFVQWERDVYIPYLNSDEVGHPNLDRLIIGSKLRKLLSLVERFNPGEDKSDLFRSRLLDLDEVIEHFEEFSTELLSVESAFDNNWREAK